LIIEYKGILKLRAILYSIWIKDCRISQVILKSDNSVFNKEIERKIQNYITSKDRQRQLFVALTNEAMK